MVLFEGPDANEIVNHYKCGSFAAVRLSFLRG